MFETKKRRVQRFMTWDNFMVLSSDEECLSSSSDEEDEEDEHKYKFTSWKNAIAEAFFIKDKQLAINEILRIIKKNYLRKITGLTPKKTIVVILNYYKDIFCRCEKGIYNFTQQWKEKASVRRLFEEDSFNFPKTELKDVDEEILLSINNEEKDLF